MVIQSTVSLQDLLRDGKKFKWKRPETCPQCSKNKLWGHGFVVRYFNKFKELVWIKRYQCYECKAVIVFRPVEYWPRIQSRIEDIYQALKIRLMSRHWPPWVSRQRALHWLKGYLRFRRAEVGSDHQEDNLITLLDQAHKSGVRFV
jgi:hypothetical protein